MSMDWAPIDPPLMGRRFVLDEPLPVQADEPVTMELVRDSGSPAGWSLIVGSADGERRVGRLAPWKPKET